MHTAVSKARSSLALLLLSVLILAWSGPARCAPAELGGRVSDTLGRPLAGVRIELRGPGNRAVAEAITGRDGRFTLGAAPPGAYSLVARRGGFQAASAAVDLPSGAGRDLEIELSPAAGAATVAALTIVAGRAAPGPAVSPTGANDYAVTALDIASLPTGAVTSLTDVLAQQPGVAIDQNQQIHIRNTEGPQFQYQINGVLVPLDINTNPPFLSMINPLLIKRMDLLDGVLPSRYSYATGGVVDIETKDGCEQGGGALTMVAGQRETLEPALQFSGCAGKFGYAISGLYDQGDTAFSSATPGPEPIHDFTQQVQGFGSFSYRLNADTRLSLILSSAASDNQLPDVPGLTPVFVLAGVSSYASANIKSDIDFRDDLAMLTLNGSVGQRLSYQLAYSAHYIAEDFKPDNAGELIFQGVASTTTHTDVDNTFEGDLAYQAGPHALKAGFYVGDYRVTVDDSSLVFPVAVGFADREVSFALPAPVTMPPPTGPEPVVQLSTTPSRVVSDVAATNLVLGFYVGDLWQIGARLKLDLGARLDSLSGFTNHTQFDPTINLTYQLTGAATLHGGFARYMQVPSFQGISPTADRAFFGTTGALSPGGPTPLTEDDDEWDAGLVYQLGPRVTLSQDDYFELTKHYLDTGQFGLVPIFAPFNYDHGYIWGSEFAVKYRGERLSAYANLTLGQNWQKGVVTGQFNFDDLELAYIDAHGFLLDHQPLVGVSAGAAYRTGPYAFSFDGIYSSGLRGGFADQQQLPNVVQLNVALERTFHVPGVGRIVDRLTVVNVLDRVNLIRPAEGIGIFQAAYGPRFTLSDSLTIPF
jgi:hypothetical protein